MSLSKNRYRHAKSLFPDWQYCYFHRLFLLPYFAGDLCIACPFVTVTAIAIVSCFLEEEIQGKSWAVHARKIHQLSRARGREGGKGSVVAEGKMTCESML
eukprot:4295305-Amphidinium_carterae.1